MYFELESYAHVMGKLRSLSDAEQAALVALGWFAREHLVDWPSNYEHAINMMPTLNEDYQISLGSYWLTGLDLWESKPTPFLAGHRHPRNTKKSE